jgi:hypothetical protein
MFFLIFMLGSPNRTTTTEFPSFTHTADFFGPPGVLKGLFNAWPLQAEEILRSLRLAMVVLGITRSRRLLVIYMDIQLGIQNSIPVFI